MKRLTLKILTLATLMATLHSHLYSQTLYQDSLALVDLYNSTNGSSWTNNTNWLTSQPVSTWYGITVTNGRVTEIDLDANNVVGVLPSEIGDLDSLISIQFWNNGLSGSLPSTIGNLINLEQIYLPTK